MKNWGFLLLGLVVGYIIGNSVTSVSAIGVSSSLGFMGSVISLIIAGKVAGKESDERISKNLDTLGRILFWLSLGMLSGIILGSLLKGLYFKALQSKASKGFIYFPPTSYDITNTKP